METRLEKVVTKQSEIRTDRAAFLQADDHNKDQVCGRSILLGRRRILAVSVVASLAGTHGGRWLDLTVPWCLPFANGADPDLECAESVGERQPCIRSRCAV